MADCYASTCSAERSRAISIGKFYTYIHVTADLAGEPGRIFYVGKGKEGRAWVSRRRNPHWINISQKHGFVAVICAYWDSEDEAFSHERLLISCFRDMGHRLTNVTDGGDGVSGLIQTPEVNKKRAASVSLRLADPLIRAARLSQLSRIREDEEVQARRKIAMLAAAQRPEVRARKAQVVSTRWSNLEFKNRTSFRMKEAQSRPGVKANVAASKKKGINNHASRSVVCEETGQVFPITRDAVHWLKSLGFEKATESGICHVCQGRQKKSYGYSWRYA